MASSRISSYVTESLFYKVFKGGRKFNVLHCASDGFLRLGTIISKCHKGFYSFSFYRIRIHISVHSRGQSGHIEKVEGQVGICE